VSLPARRSHSYSGNGCSSDWLETGRVQSLVHFFSDAGHHLRARVLHQRSASNTTVKGRQSSKPNQQQMAIACLCVRVLR
jgi:hypothetical protein